MGLGPWVIIGSERLIPNVAYIRSRCAGPLSSLESAARGGRRFAPGETVLRSRRSFTGPSPSVVSWGPHRRLGSPGLSLAPGNCTVRCSGLPSAAFFAGARLGAATRERCPSGRRSTPGKCVYAQKVYRGFESHPLRQSYATRNFCRLHDSESMVARAGTSATRGCEPRQAREGAAAAAERVLGRGWHGPPP